MLKLCKYDPTDLVLIEDTQIQRDPLSHPDGSLRVISSRRSLRAHTFFRNDIRMNKYGQWTAPDSEPWNECTELCRGEQVNLKHSDRMWTNWSIPQSIDSQLWNYIRRELLYNFCLWDTFEPTLSSDAFPQFSRVFGLLWARLEIVYMDVAMEWSTGRKCRV